ncbi:hypothetical protein M8J77_012060 [Diaphorina citri]|nr:hypothetical protein M8J77_012060 [Diaphorina citri]
MARVNDFTRVDSSLTSLESTRLLFCSTRVEKLFIGFSDPSSLAHSPHIIATYSFYSSTNLFVRKTIRLNELNDSLPPSPLLLDDDDDARKRTEEGEGYSGIPVCREFPNENPNISDSLAYSTLE